MARLDISDNAGCVLIVLILVVGYVLVALLT